MTTIKMNETNDIIVNEFEDTATTTNNDNDSNIRILTFIDYNDLQTRLVVLPRNEEIDEGIGAIISMYYRYDSLSSTSTTPINNSSTTTDNTSDIDVTQSLVLDTSLDGYTLVQIGTNDIGNNNETTIDSTTTTSNNNTPTQPIQDDHQFDLLDEDFASILSRIRHHPSTTPIVLKFMKQITHTNNEEHDESSSNNNIDECVNVDTQNDTATISNNNNNNNNNTNLSKEPYLSICEDEKKTDDHELSTSKTTTVVVATTSTSITTNENDTTIAIAQNVAANNDSYDIAPADQTPPLPPPQDESSLLSPSTTSTTNMFSSKNLSSIWNNRIRTVANTKAVVAFVNAANEHAKHTTALVTSVVIPDFPSSTSSTSTAKVDTTNTIGTATTVTTTAAVSTTTDVAAATEAPGTEVSATTDVATPAEVTTKIIDTSNTIQVSQDTSATSLVDEVDTQKESLSETINASIVENKTPSCESEIKTVEAINTSLENNNSVPSPISLPHFNIYIQSETGAFVPVPEVASSSLSNTTITSSTPITNSSYVMMRISITEPAPINKGYYYQWYRSSLSSSSKSENEWVKLLGANTPTLQPSATEIGYRLRCVISTTKNYELHINDSSNSNHSNQNHVIICETKDTVTASLPILNGSRQALARGAQFGGLLGQGKAENRTFRVKIVLSSQNNNSNNKTLYENGSWSQHSSSTSTNNINTIAAVTIYQVSGTIAEPIHPENEPLLCRAATVWDYSQIKDIALIFNSHELPPSASMVAALCSHEKLDDIDSDTEGQRTNDDDDENHHYFDPTKNHRLYFRLQAPNRLARESMLLSIGIANYQGKPSELNASTILFHHEEHSHDGSNSGSASSSLGDDSIVSHTSPSPPWPPTSTPQKIIVKHHSSSVDGDAADCTKSDLELELEALRSKLARKDKVISELQRQVTHSDEVQRHTEEELRSVQSKLEQTQKESLTLRKSLSKSEDKVKNIDEEIQKVKLDHESRYEAIEGELQWSKNRITTLEKENRILQNDKDVLKAAIESRDFKLMKMEELQASLDEARGKLSQQNNFQLEVDEANKRYTNAMKDAERLRVSIHELEEELSTAKEQIISLQQSLQIESTKNLSHQSKLEMEQMKVQKLKAERNSYKQKCDSLAKEMNRICRDGRSIREIEKILADDATRREEVNVLREQKRKALEQVEQFRTAYEQSVGIQKLAGLDHDSIKLLERNAELERLLSELTEYVTAKEMQLDTMKQVNDTLQFEIRELAKASMSKNDI